MTTSPTPLSRYKVILAPAGDEFDKRVSEALDQGYEPCGGVGVVASDTSLRFAQAVVWAGEGNPPSEAEQEEGVGEPGPYRLDPSASPQTSFDTSDPNWF
ncbi:DUF1737 domain-containing protein [Tsukamurella ocularis]